MTSLHAWLDFSKSKCQCPGQTTGLRVKPLSWQSSFQLSWHLPLWKCHESSVLYPVRFTVNSIKSIKITYSSTHKTYQATRHLLYYHFIHNLYINSYLVLNDITDAKMKKKQQNRGNEGEGKCVRGGMRECFVLKGKRTPQNTHRLIDHCVLQPSVYLSAFLTSL